MQNKIIIIESPNKRKKIEHYSGCKVIATVGHFMRMPLDRLGIDLETYIPEFEIDPDKKQIYYAIKKESENAIVYIATDPDREGYAIGFDVYRMIKKSAAKIYRAEFREITEEGIKNGLDNAVEFDKTNKFQHAAFLARRGADRIIGYTLSPLASSKLAAKHSVGRVQSPALSIVVERENEILGFKSQSSWTISAIAKHNEAQYKFKFAGDNFKSKDDAEKYIENLRNISAIVISSDVEKEIKKPAPPFTTSTLQQEANKKLKLSAKDCMALAQSLFDAGYITYLRTDSVRISSEFVREARNFISATYVDCLPDEPKQYSSKNSQADAHECIRPTKIHSLESLKSLIKIENFSQLHIELLLLIQKRSLASQMLPSIYNKRTIKISIGDDVFAYVTSQCHFLGWEYLYSQEQNNYDGITFLDVNTILEIECIDIEKVTTQPPQRYTEGKLVKKLEHLGIGRPSTYASIIEGLKIKKYIIEKKNQFLPEDKGFQLVNWLKKEMCWILDYTLTSELENRLDMLADGKGGYKELIKYYHSLTGFINPEKIQINSNNNALCQCPSCDGQIVKMKKIYGCTNVQATNCPERIFIESFGHKIKEKEAIELFKSGRTLKPVKCMSRAGKQFEAYLTYKDKKIAIEFEKEKEKGNKENDNRRYVERPSKYT